MSAWALIVFVVVVTGATLWVTAWGWGGASRRARPAERRAGLEVGPPIETIRLPPSRRTPAAGSADARRGAP